MAKGCDYSWGRPTMSGLKAAGIEFAVRYVSHDNTGKNLTAGEANALRATGIDVVTNWEFAERAALLGRAQGIADAANGINMANAIGAPSHAAIYFSVDFDAQDADMRQVAAYIDGAVATIGYDRVGVYGGYRVIANMAATNRCKYFWQTYAWSGGAWHSAAQLRQIQNGVTVGGADVDIDQSMTADIGSWNGPGSGAPSSVATGPTYDLATPLDWAADWLQGIGDRFHDNARILDSI